VHTGKVFILTKTDHKTQSSCKPHVRNTNMRVISYKESKCLKLLLCTEITGSSFNRIFLPSISTTLHCNVQ